MSFYFILLLCVTLLSVIVINVILMSVTVINAILQIDILLNIISSYNEIVGAAPSVHRGLGSHAGNRWRNPKNQNEVCVKNSERF